MRDIIIIGGGASALMASLLLNRSGKDVEILEKNSSVGKKILASGNGRCNIINTHASKDDFFGNDSSFVTYALKQLSFDYFKKLCSTISIVLDIKDDGRCYPLSNEAKSVVEAFKAALTNITITTDITVLSIKKIDDIFFIESTNGVFKAKKVLIATGSSAAPQLGSSGDGYAFASSFGHKIVPAYPTLVQYELEYKYLSKLSGAKTIANLTLFANNQKLTSVSGDILFTPYGISGLAVLDSSIYGSKALCDGKKLELSLELLPMYSVSELENLLSHLVSSAPTHSIETILSSLLPSKIAISVLIEANISKAINKKEIKKLSHLIKNWRFVVSDTHGYKHAEVSGGGVDTTQINPKTMESQLVKNLYFSGEVVDIVGRRGGFNFYFAFASAIIAAKEMAKS